MAPQLKNLPEELLCSIASRTDKHTRLMSLACVGPRWKQLVEKLDNPDLQEAHIKRKDISAFLAIGPTGQAVRKLVIGEYCEPLDVVRQLRHPSLRLTEVEIVAVLARLPNLSSLAIMSQAPLSILLHLQSISACTQLSLCLGKDSSHNRKPAQKKAMATCLNRIALATMLEVLYLDIEPFDSAVSLLAPLMPSFSRLRELALNGRRSEIGADCRLQVPPFTSVGLNTLRLYGRKFVPSQHFGVFSSMTHLEFKTENWSTVARHMEGFVGLKHLGLWLHGAPDVSSSGDHTWVSQLTCLKLGYATRSEGLEVALAALSLPNVQVVQLIDTSFAESIAWNTCTALQSCSFEESEVGSFFSTGYTGLTSLVIECVVENGFEISGLPAGPYLSNLRQLVVEVRFEDGEIPEHLAEAQQLTKLVFKRCEGLVVTKEGAQVLLGLPTMLRELEICRCSNLGLKVYDDSHLWLENIYYSSVDVIACKKCFGEELQNDCGNDMDVCYGWSSSEAEVSESGGEGVHEGSDEEE